MKRSHRFAAALLACALVAGASGCGETRTQESTGQYVDDAAIKTKVKAALLQDQSLKSLQIEVETYKGEVQLSGFVDSPQMVARATDVVRSVSGVKSVKNSLVVK